MTIVRVDTVAVLRSRVTAWRREGRSIGFVPTMGALHDGHASLIRAARAECDRVVVSVFVNPKQFGPGEDLDRYPRALSSDMAVAEAAGADVVFAPSVDEMYPENFATTVSVGGLTDGLCGASRPGHFDGVTTVVARLLGMVGPDRAYFGQKDYQQVAVIRRMVADLAMPVRVVACPTEREPDGLAMSSRNLGLDVDQRQRASAVPLALQAGAALVASGPVSSGRVCDAVGAVLTRAGGKVDYVAAVDPERLTPVDRVVSGTVLLVAVHFGKTRLIDNLIVP